VLSLEVNVVGAVAKLLGAGRRRLSSARPRREVDDHARSSEQVTVVRPITDVHEVDMTQPAVVLLVRLRSSLPRDDVLRIMRERMPEFRAIEGLQQKYYLEDPETGEYGGLYLWRSPGDLAEYKESELRATIAEAYGAEGEPRVEVLTVLEPLRDQ
jgi:hypothetical protein